jgi:outer membrane lipoprotein SlyB
MKVTRNSLRIMSLFVLISVAGCAASSGANYRPIVDNKGVDLNRYESDLRECQTYATQTAGAAESAAVGAVAGAALGAVLAAAAGGNYSRANSAKVGAVGGAVGAGAQGETDQRNIIRRCLAGRGYRVLQ